MPVAIVKKYSRLHKVPISEVEDIWDEAKKITKDKFNLSNNESTWYPTNWAYTTTVFKRKVKGKYGDKGQ